MNRFEKIILWGATIGVTLSGTGLGILKYFVVSDDPFAVVNDPWQPFFLKMHVLSAPMLVFGVGLVFLKHIWKQWRSGTPAGRRTGATVLFLLVPMIATGYLVQTVTGRTALRWIVAVHLVSSGAYLFAILGHWVRSLTGARASRRGAAPAAREAS